MCTGCSDCACVSSGPSHAPMQQQSGQVQSSISSTSLSLPGNSYGSSASVSGYSHAAPPSQGSMIQGPGPGYGSSSSSSSTSSSSSSTRSNLNMQSNQGEPGLEEPSKSFNFTESNSLSRMNWKGLALNERKGVLTVVRIEQSRTHMIKQFPVPPVLLNMSMSNLALNTSSTKVC